MAGLIQQIFIKKKQERVSTADFGGKKKEQISDSDHCEEVLGNLWNQYPKSKGLLSADKAKQLMREFITFVPRAVRQRVNLEDLELVVEVFAEENDGFIAKDKLLKLAISISGI